MDQHFHPYASLQSQALNSCHQITQKMNQMNDLLKQSKFKSHYKLLMYEMLENLYINCEVAKRHIDEAYKTVEEQIKQIPHDD